jgi:plasmid stabilization system protein ParE
VRPAAHRTVYDRLRFSPGSGLDLDEIWEYIADDSVDAADKVVVDILARIDAHRLGIPRANVDRLFDLQHFSRPEQIENAFAALGKQVDIQVRNVAISA